MQPRNPEGYFWHPSPNPTFSPESRPDFAFKSWIPKNLLGTRSNWRSAEMDGGLTVDLNRIADGCLLLNFRGLAADEKRRLDSRIGQLEEEVEEERTQNELLVEKYKRANMQVHGHKTKAKQNFFISLPTERSLSALENSRLFATPPLVSPLNDVWETRAEIPYWWRSDLGSACDWLKICFNQSQALPRSRQCRVTSFEFLCSFFRCRFAENQCWRRGMSAVFSG